MPSTVQVKQAITGFLDDMLEKKVAERQKEIDGLRASNMPADAPKMVSALAKLEAVRQHYEYDFWIEHAATKLVNHATLATHISKGIHSMSRGDSVLFSGDATNTPSHLVGSHTTPSKVLDISGSASALPLYNFMNTPVDEEFTIRDLIQKRSIPLINALSDDQTQGRAYLRMFKTFLEQTIKNPATSSLNKQMLFPVNGDVLNVDMPADNNHVVDGYKYVNTVPLYSSVFCYEIRQKINDIRFSENNKQASTNRFSDDAKHLEHKPYQTIRNLGVLKLGGAKPANISKVVVMSHGETLLLPTLPPSIAHPDDFLLEGDATDLFKTVGFHRQTKTALKELASAYIHNGYQPNYENKRRQRNALYFLLTTIFDLAAGLRTRQAGWLDNYSLMSYQKYWLDPQASTTGRTQSDWQSMVLDAVASYINTQLHSMLIRNANEFDDKTFSEWRKAAVVIANKYKLNNREVLS